MNTLTGWKRRAALVFASVCLSITLSASARATDTEAGFELLNVEHFKPLSSFNTVADFEKTITRYQETCLSSYAASLAGRACFIAEQLWDRELNTYYKKLMTQLSKRRDESAKHALITSQRTWLKSRDESHAFHNQLLQQKYHGYDGTMYRFMEARDYHRTALAMTKARALLLKHWTEFDWYVDS